MSDDAPLPKHPRLVARGRRRGMVALTVLLAWALGVGMLVRQEFFRERSAVLAEAALRLAPGVSFFAVERNGRQVGFASTTIDTSTTSFEVVDYAIIDQPGGGEASRASERAVITLSRSLALRTFDVSFESPEGARTVLGEAEGDSVLSFVVQRPEAPADSQRLAVGGPMLLPTLIPSVAMLTGDPEVGRRVAVPSFDPRTLVAHDVLLRFAAESLFTLIDSARFDSTSMRFVSALTDTVRAWRLEPDAEGQPDAFSGWVDAQGRVVLATRPGGLTLRRIAYEIAFENWRRDRDEAAGGGAVAGGSRGSGDAGTPGAVDPARAVLRGTAISAGALPARPGPSTLRLRLTGVTLDRFDLLGGRQRLFGDTVIITREPARLLEADWSLASPAPGFRQRFEPELRAEPLLQVTHRDITALALRIAGNERDPRVIAERLNRWVHDSIDKVVTVNPPNAVGVLRSRRGDAAEHAQLFTALARAAGIPTRMATGLAYLDGRFHYHAWPEVRLRDWVAVDPTFGQFPADAAHLRVVRGRLAVQGELLNMLGTLRIEVLGTP